MVLILTANIYKNKQHEPWHRETRLYRSQTQGIPIPVVPFASLARHSFLFKYSRGRLIIAPLDLRLLGADREQVAALQEEQLLPNPIIIALIKNKFSILAPFWGAERRSQFRQYGNL